MFFFLFRINEIVSRRDVISITPSASWGMERSTRNFSPGGARRTRLRPSGAKRCYCRRDPPACAGGYRNYVPTGFSENAPNAVNYGTCDATATDEVRQKVREAVEEAIPEMFLCLEHGSQERVYARLAGIMQNQEVTASDES